VRLKRLAVILLIVVLALVLAAAVMAWQGSYLRERIVRPLSYAFWIASILILGTPQAIFWGILLLITVVMALRSLFASPREPPRPQLAESASYRRSRLRFWLHQLLLNRYETARFQLYESVGRLVMDVLAYQQGITLQQFQRQIDPNEINPEFLAPFLQARTQPLGRQASWNVAELRRVFGRLWEALPFRKQPTTIQYADLEQVVAYLEEQMDVE
jgi:hypothetical protein